MWLEKFWVAFMQHPVGVVRIPWSLLDNGSLKSLEVWWRGLEQEKPVSHPLNIWRVIRNWAIKASPPKRKVFRKAWFASRIISVLINITIWNWFLLLLKVKDLWFGVVQFSFEHLPDLDYTCLYKSSIKLQKSILIEFKQGKMEIQWHN